MLQLFIMASFLWSDWFCEWYCISSVYNICHCDLIVISSSVPLHWWCGYNFICIFMHHQLFVMTWLRILKRLHFCKILMDMVVWRCKYNVLISINCIIYHTLPKYISVMAVLIRKRNNLMLIKCQHVPKFKSTSKSIKHTCILTYLKCKHMPHFITQHFLVHFR